MLPTLRRHHQGQTAASVTKQDNTISTRTTQTGSWTHRRFRKCFAHSRDRTEMRHVSTKKCDGDSLLSCKRRDGVRGRLFQRLAGAKRERRVIVRRLDRLDAVFLVRVRLKELGERGRYLDGREDGEDALRRDLVQQAHDEWGQSIGDGPAAPFFLGELGGGFAGDDEDGVVIYRTLGAGQHEFDVVGVVHNDPQLVTVARGVYCLLGKGKYNIRNRLVLQQRTPDHLWKIGSVVVCASLTGGVDVGGGHD